MSWFTNQRIDRLMERIVKLEDDLTHERKRVNNCMSLIEGLSKKLGELEYRRNPASGGTYGPGKSTY